MKNKKRIILTGAAGFIGFHLSKSFCENGFEVFGLDNLNDYYDVKLKHDRLNILKDYSNFEFEKIDISDRTILKSIWEKFKPDYVVHLAAQAGVRYSIDNPMAYIDSNILGFANILEACREFPVKHLVYASSSSVYGANKKLPFSEKDNVDHPVSLYAATKKSNELMAYTYSHLYSIPTTGLRFFTVYGPYGRPDMAYFSFTKNILNGKSLEVYNHGNLERDFTYIDDIINGIINILPIIPAENISNDKSDNVHAPYQIFNIGNNNPVKLMEFIRTLEDIIGKKANLKFLPMQPGDVYSTYADITALNSLVDFEPKSSIKTGLEVFVKWYIDYYKI